MDKKEAIKDLKELRFHHNVMINGTNHTSKALDMAIEALEKQIPQKPIWEGDGYADGEMVYDTWYCPNCDSDFEYDDVYDYCPKCGQKICWSEGDE